MTTIIAIITAISSLLFCTNSTPMQTNETSRIGSTGDVMNP